MDHIGSDFDDKEKSIKNSNVLPRIPCTEKGYEELDVSELNMNLGYSITPASSPMSKSYTTNYEKNTNVNQDDSIYSITDEDCFSNIKSNNQFLNNALSSSVAIDTDANNTIEYNGSNNIDENLSFHSTSSSSVHTPKALSPTKWSAGRAMQWVLTGLTNLFKFFLRATPPAEHLNQEHLSQSFFELNSLNLPRKDSGIPRTPSTSTPIKINKNKECHSSQLKDFVRINYDLEEDLLQLKEDLSIIRKEEIAVPELIYQRRLLKSVKQTPETSNKLVSEVTGNHDVKRNKQSLEINNNSNIEWQSGIMLKKSSL